MCRTMFAVVLALAGLASCKSEDRPVPPSIAAAFPELPLPPLASFVSRAGGENALTITLRSGVGMLPLRDYYRTIFQAAPWVLRNEARDPEGAVVLYAERYGRPLWVRLVSEGEKSTLVELNGAVPRNADSVDRANRPVDSGARGTTGPPSPDSATRQ